MKTVGDRRGDRARRSRSCPTPRCSRRWSSRRDALAAPARDGVPDARPADLAHRRARRRRAGRVPLRRRDQGFRRLHRTRRRIPSTGTSSTSRARPRRAGRGRDAVEHLLPGVGLLVRQQHQHARGRHPHAGFSHRADATLNKYARDKGLLRRRRTTSRARTCARASRP